MCLAVPMKISRILGSDRARASRESEEMEIDISLVASAKTGDYVIVHAGYALEIVEDEDARERIELLREIES